MLRVKKGEQKKEGESMRVQRCGSCKYADERRVRVGKDEYRIVCRRYPTSAVKQENEVCGEWKGKPKGDKV